MKTKMTLENQHSFSIGNTSSFMEDVLLSPSFICFFLGGGTCLSLGRAYVGGTHQ